MTPDGLHFSTLLNTLMGGLAGQPNPFRWAWDRLRAVPFGPVIFSRLLGRYIPYTGSVHPEVVQLERGFARVQMKDAPAIRNHLDCIHAIALSNLAELTGNLAIVYSMPDDARFIVKSLQIEFLKKARGTIVAECRCPIPTTNAKASYPLSVSLTDDSGEVVARATMDTLLGPKK